MRHVVIIGAGPAGAALSYLLARRGVEVTLVERHSDFAREFRGEVLQPSGIEAFEQMGLLPALNALPQRQGERFELYRDGKPLCTINLQQQVSVIQPRVISQPAMLEMLVNEAGHFPSFRFERGVSARALLWEEGRVVGVRLISQTREWDLRGDFVIGADGRASLIRKQAGLDEEQSPQTFDIVWCRVPYPSFLSYAARLYLGRGHFAIAYPSFDGRLQIGWVIDKGAFGDLRRRGIDEWLVDLAAHVSSDLGDHLREHRTEVTKPFLLDVVLSRATGWTVPGLLIIGDAAHPMSPIGAQGINIALRDALVAANHLCPILANEPSADALDAAAARVQEERLPEVSKIQRMQKVPPRLLFQRSLWARTILSALPLLVRMGIAQRGFRFLLRRMAHGLTRVRLEV